MALEQEADVALFEQLKVFDPKKFLLKLEDLTKQGHFLLEVIYGAANLTDKSEKNDITLNSRANYILTHSSEDGKVRTGTVYFETGTRKDNDKDNYFENMIMITEEHLKIEGKDIPKINLKIRLLLSNESDKLICRRYDRQRVLFGRLGWTRTPQLKPLLETHHFIKDQYLKNLEETFNGDYTKE